ncbi:AraC family transcriptional regulator ligand-binding domain-containing protein [Colwellia sp. PAMC 21821]|uniref:AraC family transcriptional regulator n=1 Tax=Colwellia sp. PAMC 21821 TaxID=1816219 RepID=UPI0009BEE9DB|nr:AraC family transcriptional regulator ligand-binding domain-containing protein [Colwellia sp. PAMC 21821]ARD43211.1 hypothetical protein A3Q33_02090 [Colwellia sp. PAMC 21821]
MSDVSREYCQIIAANIPKSWLNCQRIPIKIYLQGLNITAKEMRDTLWGFTVGKTITSAEYGLLGYLVESCDSLKAALDALLQFDKTVADIGEIQFTNIGNTASLKWLPYFQNRHAVLRNMTAWVATVRRLTGKQLTPTVVNLQDDFSSKELKTLTEWFGCSVQASCDSNDIIFDISLLTMPILTRNELVNNHLLLATQEAKKSFIDQRGWLSQIQPVLHSADLHHFTLMTLAGTLCMSPRTLQRKLKLNEMSFSQLLDDERKRRFEQFGNMMRKQMLSNLLGYSEQASLNRASKRWFGVSPSQYFKKHST